MGVETELMGLKNREDGSELRVIESDVGRVEVYTNDFHTMPIWKYLPSSVGAATIPANNAPNFYL